MIRLSRKRDAAAIPASVRGPAMLRQYAPLLGAKGKRPEWNPKFWRGAKPGLLLESGGKCAYCEARTEVVAPGDVEHYRPKSRYWWLAYWYGNYLYACELCNRLYKGDRFPVQGRRMSAPRRAAGRQLVPDPLCGEAEWRAYGKRLAAERPLLPNPYLIDPEPLFTWSAKADLGEVTVAPARRRGRGAAIARAAIALYGLNRPELRRARWRVWRELQLLLESRTAVRSPKLAAEIDAELSTMTSPAADFTAMARFVVKRWHAPC